MRRLGRWAVVCLTSSIALAETIPTVVPIAGEKIRLVPTEQRLGAPPDDELTRDPHVREMMKLLWRAASLGASCWERAAWIVRNEDGSFSCVQVPPTGECFRLTLSTERPEGAVALIHTHPTTLGATRLSNGNDIAAAEKIGLPLYTLGFSGLLKYDPETNIERVVERGMGWMSNSAADACACEVQTPIEIRMAKVRAASKRNVQRAASAAAPGAIGAAP